MSGRSWRRGTRDPIRVELNAARLQIAFAQQRYTDGEVERVQAALHYAAEHVENAQDLIATQQKGDTNGNQRPR